MGVILETLPTHSEFLTNSGSIFEVLVSDGSIREFYLQDVSDPKTSQYTVSFSLLFRAPADIAPEQGTYRMKHPELGIIELFLVPTKRDADGIYFESIFNNLAAKAA